MKAAVMPAAGMGKVVDCESYWVGTRQISGQHMENKTRQLLRNLPSVDALLTAGELQPYIPGLGRKTVTEAVRRSVDAAREHLLAQTATDFDETGLHKLIIADAKRRLTTLSEPFYKRVVNATGIILHTALGRAALPARALAQIQETLGGYSLLQMDPETGKRSSRDERIEWLLQQLTGAEAATVVNNNAAATAIVLNTVAQGREVIVSRGQLVEIGGSFRLPDVMAFSGAKLVEVGATNKTHPRDYEQAITENTAAILRVHPSNYKIQGFSSEVPLDVLVKIAHDHNLVMIDDVGAGSLIDFSQFGFEPEPTLPQSVSSGADIITSSADKLIGASQGGIILGKKKLIDAIRKNQFARIVRVGKLTLAVLEATLKLFLDQTIALQEVPTLTMLRRSGKEIAKHAERLARELRKKTKTAAVTTVEGWSQMGSGSLPTQNLATTLVAIEHGQIGAEAFAKRLRLSKPPIFARIANERVLIDPRTLLDGDDEAIINAVAQIATDGD